MDRHELTRHVAYGLYRHRGRMAGTAFGDWSTAEQILDLVATVFAPAEQEASPPEPVITSQAEPRDVPKTRKLPRGVDPAAAALELLQAFVAESTRAEAASRLGYKSPSSVGKILRGQRSLSPALIEKIQQAFGQTLRKAG